MRIETDLDRVIAKRLREERLARGWTLDQLAAASSVSRAMISKIERQCSMPTAVLLAKLAGAMNLTLTSLMSERGEQLATVRRAHEQSVWIDPETKYSRRLVSGGEAEVEIVAIELPPGAVVTFNGADTDIHEEQVLMLEGSLTLRTDQASARLDPGDLGRFSSGQLHAFANDGEQVARYLVMKRQR